MTKKQIAIQNACTMFEKLMNHRGVTFDVDTDLYIPRNATIANINSIAKDLEKKIELPLEPATEKQINYLLILSKGYPEENQRIKESRLNKFQASKLIGLYKYAKDLMFSHNPIAYQEETWVNIDKEIDYILSTKTL